MTNLSTNDYKLQNANRLIEDIVNSNSYYLWVGNFLPQTNTTLQPVYDNVANTFIECYSNMIFGKKILASNVLNMINNVQYVANTVYNMYDDADPNLISESFYVITTEGSNYHIWKILDNNFNSPSTIQPLFAYASSTPYYQSADGYRWKYMTTVSDVVATQFDTSNYFPVIANTTVQSAATPGALDIFLVESNGAFYNNWVTDTFQASDILINGDPTLYNISNNDISQVAGFYTGCLLYLTGGVGQGQYVNIVDYVANTTGNILKIAAAFPTPPQNGTQYQITPQLNIISDGKQTVNCVARALVNSTSSNSIYRIESLAVGKNYINVSSISVTVNAVVGVTNNAIIRAILGPNGGHGANVYSELYSNSVGIAMSLSNTENNTILTTNIYQQIGLLNNPLFANVVMNLSTSNGTFSNGETVYAVTVEQFAANCITVAGNSTITSAIYSPNAMVIALANVTVTGGTAYTNGDLITVSNSTYVNAVANITTNSTGGFTNSGINILNVGLFRSSNTSLAVTAISNSSGGTSTGSSATLTINLNTATYSNFVSVAGSANFVNQLGSTNTFMISTPNGSNNQLATLNAVTNATSLTITSPALFSCTAAVLYYITIKDSAVVTNGGSNSIIVTNSTCNFATGSTIIGSQSGAFGTINTMTRSGINQFYNTFNEMYKYTANIQSGSFIAGEQVTQGNNSAYFYGTTTVANNLIMYLDNFEGSLFGNGTVITGSNSGATANVSPANVPDVIYGTGDILYIENISPVTRSNNQNENFNFILNF